MSKRFAIASAILTIVASSMITGTPSPADAQAKPDSGVAPANSTTPPGKSPAPPKPEPPPPPPGKDDRAAARARTDKAADVYMEAWRKLKEALCSGDKAAILKAYSDFGDAKGKLDFYIAAEVSVDQNVYAQHEDMSRAGDAFAKLNANPNADESAVQAARKDANLAANRWLDAYHAQTAAIIKRLEANGVDFNMPKAACPPPTETPPPTTGPSNDSHSSAPRHAAAGEDASGAMLAHINFARTDPTGFAATFTGAKSADAAETLAYLRGHAPVMALLAEPALTNAAMRHVIDQGAVNTVGHIGTDGSGLMDRVHDAGIYASAVGEEISLHEATPAGAVWQLLIDQGNPGKKHRIDLMSPGFQFMGAACGPQSAYQDICVVDLTGPIMARRPPALAGPGSTQAAPPELQLDEYEKATLAAATAVEKIVTRIDAAAVKGDCPTAEDIRGLAGARHELVAAVRAQADQADSVKKAVKDLEGAESAASVFRMSGAPGAPIQAAEAAVHTAQKNLQSVREGREDEIYDFLEGFLDFWLTTEEEMHTLPTTLSICPTPLDRSLFAPLAPPPP